jgi:hypothetical protein
MYVCTLAIGGRYEMAGIVFAVGDLVSETAESYSLF